MEYKITPMFPFKVIGFQKVFDNETAYAEIPKFWDEICGKYAANVYAGNAPANACEQALVDNCEKLLAAGVCREQARGVLPQNMMVTCWGTVDLANLLHFLELRDSDHAQLEIREYAQAIKKLIKPYIPHIAEYFAKRGQEW